MKTIAGDFATRGIISTEMAERVGTEIEYYWPDPTTDMQRVIRPMNAGQFLS